MMSIRLQALMAILPIFMAVGVISGYLRYSAELEELGWGLRSEAEGYAIAIESALRGKPFEDLTTQQPSASRTLSRIDQILGNGRVRRVVAVSLDGTKTVFQRETEAAGKERIAFDGDALRSLEQLSVWVSAIERGAQGSAYMRAYVPMRDDAGTVVGALIVETDAMEYVQHAEQSFRQVVGESGGVLLLGFLCALVIAQALRRRIRELKHLAVEIGSGSSPRIDHSGAIRELKDLKDSLQTMSSIMTDILVRAKRHLLECEQQRTQSDLAETYHELCADSGCVELDGTQLVCCPTARPADGEFSHTLIFEDKVCVVFGKVKGGDFPNLTRSASAVAELSADLVRRRGAERAWEAVRGSFELRSWCCVSYARDAAFIEMWQGAADGEKLNYQMHPIGRGHVLFHSAAGQPDENIRRYVEVFGAVAPYDLRGELSSLMRNGERGALVIVGAA